MIGRDARQRRGVHREIGDKAIWPAQDAVEREDWTPRREAARRRPAAENGLQNGQRGALAAAPLVEIAHQDRRHRRHFPVRLQQRARLIEPRPAQQPQMRRDDAELAFP